MYGIGVHMQHRATKTELLRKGEAFFVSNAHESMATQDIKYLPENYMEYFWIPWPMFNNDSIELAIKRMSMKTRVQHRKTYIKNYSGGKHYDKVYRKQLDPEGLKALLPEVKTMFFIGACVGKGMIEMELKNIKCYGMEIRKDFIASANPIIRNRIQHGDFLVDLPRVGMYDAAYTSSLNFVHPDDLYYVALDIKKMCKTFVYKLIKDENLYNHQHKRIRNVLNEAGFSVIRDGLAING